MRYNGSQDSINAGGDDYMFDEISTEDRRDRLRRIDAALRRTVADIKEAELARSDLMYILDKISKEV